MKKIIFTLQILASIFALNLQASDDFLWENGTDWENGWKTSPWFGTIYTEEYPWTYHHEEDSWLWIDDLGELNDAESFWVWDAELVRWRFNPASSYPWLYIWDDEAFDGFWGFVSDDGNGTQFYIDESGKWLPRELTRFHLEPQSLLQADSFIRGNQQTETWEDIDDMDELDYDDNSGVTYYHTVTLDSYSIGKYEITNHEFVEVMNWGIENGHITVNGDRIKNTSGSSYDLIDLSLNASVMSIDEGRLVSDLSMDAYPAVGMSWFGAVVYCNLRSLSEGLTPCFDQTTWECDLSANGYRLPTEAEWEYAARGGLSTERYPWGNTITHDNANYYSYKDSTLAYDESITSGFHPDFDEGPAPIASFAANAYGLYDMAGNVWEWCYDRYDNRYEEEDETNPVGVVAKDSSKRSIRGGSYQESAYACRVTNRASEQPHTGTPYIGFRICRISDIPQ